MSSDLHAPPSLNTATAPSQQTPRWKPIVALTTLVVVAVGIVAAGTVPRLARQREVAATTGTLKALARRVTVTSARIAAPLETLTLPASLRPNATAELYAQATGYVRELKADIGDRVKTGGTLAVIDVPLLDEELNRARAALAEAVAAKDVLARNFALAASTLERVKSVTTAGAVSQQMLDERQSAYDAAKASAVAGDAAIASRRADVQRYEQSQAFSRVVAPFDGTVTARNTEVGDFVNSTNGGTPLFRVADTATLRAFIDVPQSFAAGVVAGREARVKLREFAGRDFRGVIARTSGALDERTRTLRVEIHVNNERGELLAGSYAQVELDLERAVKAVIVPGSAVLIRAEGARVAVVDGERQLRYRPVRLGRDLGTEVEILEGLTGDEAIVVNMADELPEGSSVERVPLPGNPPPASTTGRAAETPAREDARGVSK